ncbi:uncharacterized protein UTRI_02812_B [Ustilago trichophora]|uniref:Wax synthase domain-containing protein n=1 Tax=Ustilago trichophora TaxID=86804 RepID=A0A5C3E772_9BASI|nr:uncharacterized protein UTRI_02812_B [Ustilago trichophora]
MSAALPAALSWRTALMSPIHWAVPDFYDKVPYDSTNVWILLTPLPFVILQIHLLLRYDPKATLPLRASLIPIIVLLSLRSAYAYYYRVTGEGQLDGRGQQINITLGCGAFSTIFWSVGWGLTMQRPRLKVQKPQLNGSAKNGEKDDGYRRTSEEPSLPICFPGSSIPLELDLLLNIRGVGWEHGVKDGPPALPVREFTSHERWAWILERMRLIPIYFLMYDAIVVLISDPRFNVHAGTSQGGSMWDCNKGSFGVAGPYLICLAFASSFICVQYMLHTLAACVSIAVFNDRPSRWGPPAVRAAWFSTSVREFWGKKWHQFLRITFMMVGYWPVRAALLPIAGRRVANIAAIWGAFIASGLLHDMGRVAMLPEPGWCITGVTLFFAIQPIAIFAEQFWEHCTGRKIRGFWGWLWTFCWILFTSPLLIEAMSTGGMLAARIESLNLTHRPVTHMLDWWDRKFNSI